MVPNSLWSKAIFPFLRYTQCPRYFHSGSGHINSSLPRRSQEIVLHAHFWCFSLPPQEISSLPCTDQHSTRTEAFLPFFSRPRSRLLCKSLSSFLFSVGYRESDTKPITQLCKHSHLDIPEFSTMCAWPRETSRLCGSFLFLYFHLNKVCLYSVSQDLPRDHSVCCLSLRNACPELPVVSVWKSLFHFLLLLFKAGG